MRRSATHNPPTVEQPPAATAERRPGPDRLELLARLGERAFAEHDPGPVLDEAVRMVSDALDVEYAKILELLPGGREVRLVSGVGWKEGLVGNATVSTGLESQAGYTLASDHPVVVDDLRTEPRFSGPSLLREHGVVSGLSVIIPGQEDGPYGVFGAHTKERRAFDADDVRFLQAVAHIVAGTIAQARARTFTGDTKDRLQREVRQRTEQLSSAVRDLEAFNGMVAHDLREPIRSVTFLAHVLREDYDDRLDDEGRRLLGNLADAAVRMRLLVDDLLSFSRLGQTPLRMEDIDLTAMARQRWELLAANEPSRQIRFTVDDDLKARGDPRLIEIVLDNLLGNARKFTRQQKDPLVEVGTTPLPIGGTAFYVRDNGAGFPSEHANQLFHVFRRLHSRADFEGTGMGLATVQRIVDRHGGTAWAESDGPGRGATFYFRLLPAGLP